MLRERWIEPVEVESCYETGLPNWYVVPSNGLRFHWYSWILCVVMGRPDNPPHYVICTHFRTANYHKTGLASKLMVTRWNPTYEDDEHREDIALETFHYWKPVAVVVLNRFTEQSSGVTEDANQ